MDWSRIARLLGKPVEVASRLRRHEKRLADWEKRMEAQTKELEEVTGHVREVIGRRKSLLEKIRGCDERAEAALRDGDEASARDILLRKQDFTKLLEEARKESDVWLSAARIAKDKLAATRAEANEVLAAEGLPPIDPPSEPASDPDARVRIKIE